MTLERKGVPPPQRKPVDANAEIQWIPAPWVYFMEFCARMSHGEIEKLKIQDGVPVLAELTRQKVKFAAPGNGATGKKEPVSV